GLETLDARRHEVHDAVDLRGGQRAALDPLHDPRRRRPPVLGDEQGALGQRQVDARGLDAAELTDRAAELALERALVVQTLEEVGLPEALLVEDLEADAAALGEATAREREAHLVLPLGRHEHRAATVLELEGDLLGLQSLDDRRGVTL